MKNLLCLHNPIDATVFGYAISELVVQLYTFEYETIEGSTRIEFKRKLSEGESSHSRTYAKEWTRREMLESLATHIFYRHLKPNNWVLLRESK